MLRRTPCVGICSTTYGDLVCRGCKRFAHEIVQWNGFDADQRGAIWQRLLTLRAGAVVAVIEVVDEAALRETAHRLALATDAADPADPGHAADPANLLYEVLRRLAGRDQMVPLAALGASPVTAASAEPTALLADIDREFYRRSLAHYERNYRIPPQ